MRILHSHLRPRDGAADGQEYPDFIINEGMAIGSFQAYDNQAVLTNFQNLKALKQKAQDIAKDDRVALDGERTRTVPNGTTTSREDR